MLPRLLLIGFLPILCCLCNSIMNIISLFRSRSTFEALCEGTHSIWNIAKVGDIETYVSNSLFALSSWFFKIWTWSSHRKQTHETNVSDMTTNISMKILYFSCRSWRIPTFRGPLRELRVKVNESRFIASYLVSGSIKKVFSIDSVDIYFSKSNVLPVLSFLNIFFNKFKSLGYPRLLILWLINFKCLDLKLENIPKRVVFGINTPKVL